MMREVITRRLNAATNGDLKFQRMPDLMLIDGGKGQLTSAFCPWSSQTGYSHIPMVVLSSSSSWSFCWRPNRRFYRRTRRAPSSAADSG